MRAIAPGKLVLTGGYAVLEGAPAVVIAVDRYAAADASRTGPCLGPELRAAFGDEPTPVVDVASLHHPSGRKLGLGSSAAALVASLGARAIARGADLAAAAVRSALFELARRCHAGGQRGGSGVDVAASVFGGVLRYEIDAAGVAAIRALELPAGLRVVAYDSGASVRTSDMRARLDARAAEPEAIAARSALSAAARQACAAMERADAREFIGGAREFGRALGRLGQAVDAPIVPARFAALAAAAEEEGGA
ncbi:MAG: hypothetical protein JOZ69_09835, partial [Myxococcales bacterium]|nr:hypothetical protein [Myxococcales bacterium]